MTDPAKPFSEKPLGYALAAIVGGISSPVGILASPAVLWWFNQWNKLPNQKQKLSPWAAWAAVGVIGGPLTAVTLPWPSSPESKTTAAIPESVLTPYTPEAYPKTFEKFGSRIDVVELGRKASAQRAAKSNKCDKVSMAELSDSKSTIDDLHFWVDCENGQRFYFSENELRDPASEATAQADKAVSSSAAFSWCKERVLDKANNPSTVQFNVLMTDSSVGSSNGNRVLLLPFSAKNSFNMELNFLARCVITPDGEGEISISEQR